MPTGKRASMREGPLADLFRKSTEGTGEPDKQPAGAPPSGESHAASDEPTASQPAPPDEPERRIPSPQERLRHAFSAEIPENVLQPPEEPVAPVSDVYARPQADSR